MWKAIPTSRYISPEMMTADLPTQTVQNSQPDCGPDGFHPYERRYSFCQRYRNTVRCPQQRRQRHIDQFAGSTGSTKQTAFRIEHNKPWRKIRPDLLILNSTTVPAILIETCFLSNPGDALKISQATYQDAAAKAIGDGIIYAMSNYKLR